MTPPGFVALAAALWLAHVVSDFVFQTARVMASKRRLEAAGYLRHAATHFIMAVVCAGVFLEFRNLTAPALLVMGALAAVHAASDYVRTMWTGGGATESPGPFFLDQAWHALTILIAAWWIAPSATAEISRLYAAFAESRKALLAALAVYTTVVFGGGYAVRNLTRPLLEGMSVEEGTTVRQLKNAGMYIGWLERFLVVSALVLESPATVGLILTAKSIIRFPELKDLRFAEYFLIGTLLSISLALAGGMVLVRLLYGTFSLK